MKKTIGIYSITHIETGRIYIGQSWYIEKRWRNHKNGYGSHKIGSAIKKYGVEAFEFKILLEFDENISQETLNEKEIQIIAEMKCVAPDGFNLKLGGQSGGKISEETRKKMSEQRTGRKQSEETRRRRSESLKKLPPRSEEWKRNNRESQLGTKRGPQSPEIIKKRVDARIAAGNKWSDEQKKKMSDRMKGNKYWLGRKQTKESLEKGSQTRAKKALTKIKGPRKKKILELKEDN